MAEIPIVYFHSISPHRHPTWSRSWLTLELIYFEDFIKFLKRHQYTTISLKDYFNLKDNPNTESYICLCFDDGYVDNFIYVYPLLKKYGFIGTIFINTDFVDIVSRRRLTLFDYWENRVTFKEIDNWGFLTWEEMNEMEKSGTIDIQSHTRTHTKYYVSDEIIGFHHPGADCLYPISNRFPEKRPYYIQDSGFERLLPFGTPFFYDKSSVLARKVQINEEFEKEIVSTLRKYNWLYYNFSIAKQNIRSIYERYKKIDKITVHTETKEEYEKRIVDEICMSKKIIEEKLEKVVDYLCWPHGDNDEYVHKLAMQNGYKATTLGKYHGDFDPNERICTRIGIGALWNSRILTLARAVFNLKVQQAKFPYHQIKSIYYKHRYNRSLKNMF